MNGHLPLFVFRPCGLNVRIGLRASSEARALAAVARLSQVKPEQLELVEKQEEMK